MNPTTRILVAMAQHETSTVDDIRHALGDDLIAHPDYLVPTLRALADLELVTITTHQGNVQRVQLTALGAERAREAREGSNAGNQHH